MIRFDERSSLRYEFRRWPVYVVLILTIILLIIGILIPCILCQQIESNLSSSPTVFLCPDGNPDTEAPVISFKENSKQLYLGQTFELPNATTKDSCDDEPYVAHEGDFDVNTPGKYEITYTAEDAAGNSSNAVFTVEVLDKYAGTIYLTFDDGPDSTTEKLLDTLNKYDVKATFFVTGRGSDETLKRASDEGHTIALHTWSHNYSYIYRNMDNYFADLQQVQDRVKRVTGKESKLIRFPGGSSNTISRKYDSKSKIMSKLVGEVGKRGYTYFDWNIDSDDAGSARSSDQVYNNVTSNIKATGDYVVLQHDIKGYSVDAVERIIQYGKANGYKFEGLTKDSFTSHHGVNN